jgi:chromosome transmission fidelity protein 8
MEAIPVYPRPGATSNLRPSNPLPQLLQTPSGFAILELQGTINLPTRPEDIDMNEESTLSSKEIPIGRLIFPDYQPETHGASDTEWMKRVYMYVGKHQRLTGEVKKLPKAIAIIRKREPSDRGVENEEHPEELEIVEIIKWKILFSHRPEPVGTWIAETE